MRLADRHSKEKRSYNMAQIKSKDTKPEVFVRKYLFSKGLRYRKNDKRLPGQPDIVLPKYKTVVFVNGCFWHQHEGCKHSRLPETNAEFWKEKLVGNKRRDEGEIRELKNMGWRVMVVWTCELKPKVRQDRVEWLFEEITI
jgi:DNA mismatch endonuclease (patch repair protein)